MRSIHVPRTHRVLGPSLFAVTLLLSATSCTAMRLPGPNGPEASTGDPRIGREWVTKRSCVHGGDWGIKFLGLFPIMSPCYGTATERLYKNAHVQIEGGSIAPVNVVRDEGSTWCLLFSIPQVRVTADFVQLIPLHAEAPASPKS